VLATSASIGRRTDAFGSSSIRYFGLWVTYIADRSDDTFVQRLGIVVHRYLD